MGYRGSCACGEVTAIIGAEPVVVRQCWCHQCQKVSGGGPTHNAVFPTNSVSMRGATAQHSYVAASGNTLTHEFCPMCGTPVFAHSSARPHFRVIRLGFLDRGHGLAPTVAIWTEDAPEGAVIDPRLEQVRRQPLPPPAPSMKA